MKILWHEQAIIDLKHIRNYIARDRPAVSNKIAKTILKSIQMLKDNPSLGRNGRVPGTRELVISGTPYLVPYRVHLEAIQILRIFNTSMQWPEVFES